MEAVSTRITSRSFLKETQIEDNGYGLYSYILFSNPPDEAHRDGYVKLIQIYLSQVRPTEEFEVHPSQSVTEQGKPSPPAPSTAPTQRSRLNVTYLPVRTEISDCTAKDYERQSGHTRQDCIVDSAYDYKRAHNLLSELDKLQPSHPKHTRGPYIISTLEPIDQMKADTLVYISQDLSRVPLSVLDDHVSAFIEKASGPVSVTKRNFRAFMLSLRTEIAQVAGPVDNVLATISLVHGEPKEKK